LNVPRIAEAAQMIKNVIVCAVSTGGW